MMHVPQVMPIAKATLYTIKAVNGLAGIAQCFLPGTAVGLRGTARRGLDVPVVPMSSRPPRSLLLARVHTHTGVPTIPKNILEHGSVLLKELDAPSSVAEFDLVQATLESETKDAHKMEGGCLREFTRFLEKEVRAAHESDAPAPILPNHARFVLSGP